MDLMKSTKEEAKWIPVLWYDKKLYFFKAYISSLSFLFPQKFYYFAQATAPIIVEKLHSLT